jgi:hypothetical protein
MKIVTSSISDEVDDCAVVAMVEVVALFDEGLVQPLLRVDHHDPLSSQLDAHQWPVQL